MIKYRLGRHWLRILLIVVACATVPIGISRATQATCHPGFDDNIFLDDDPQEGEPPWSEEAQGVAHDEQNWFITQKDGLWKIPVGIDISDLIDLSNPPSFLRP